MWKFEVTADVGERLLSRILLVLDQQRVRVGFFRAAMDDVQAQVEFQVSFEQDKAYRIEMLLYGLEAVRTVLVIQLPELPAGQDGCSESVMSSNSSSRRA